jgi:protein transport protein SEC24
LKGGQINLFLAALPTLGPGGLKAREDVGLYNTDKERSLSSPANPSWVETAESAAQCGVGINTFFFPDQYTDVASVGHLSAITSGESFFHPRFDATRDRWALQEELKRVISASPTMSKEVAYDATLRVRCSAGLRVHEYLGNFYQRTMTDVELANVSERTALGVTMRYDSRLDEKELAYVQVATLYTTAAGERRVRLLNLSLHITSLIGNVFRFADLDGVVTIFAKEGDFLSTDQECEACAR